VHILNATALSIWKLCDGSRSVETIAAAVAAEFAGADAAVVRNDLQALLAGLQERGLLEPGR